MKKRFLSLSAILGTSFLMLTGFDSAATPESILQDSLAAMQNVSSFDFDTAFDMVFNIEMLTGTGEDAIPTNIGTGISGNFRMQIAEDRGMAMNINMDVATMGMTESASMEMYGTPNGDIYDLYSYDSDSGIWVYEQGDSLEVQSQIDTIMEAFKSEDYGLTEDQLFGLDFVLSDELVTVNGISCYELKATMDGSIFGEEGNPMMDLFEQSGMSEDDQLIFDYMLNGLYADLAYYVAADTKLPVQIVMDMSQTDMSAYADLMNDSLSQQMGDDSGAESVETSVNVSLNPCTFTVNMNFNNIPSITVPEEAILAVQNSEPEVSSVN